MTARPRPRLLVVTKDYFRPAGVSLHTQSLAEALVDHFDITIAVPRRATRQIALLRGGEGKAITALFAADAYGGALHDRAPTTEQSFAQILQQVQPDLVHVQHFASWPLGAMRVLMESKVKFIVSFHDHFAITPDAGMSHVDDPLECFTASYALRAFGKDISAQLTARRQLLQTIFAAATSRVTVSPYMTRVIKRVYPIECGEIEYGVDEFDPLPKLPAASGGLRFGFIGALRGNKGWRVLHEAFARLQATHPTTECRFYGGGDEPIPAAGVTFCGTYARADLPRVCSEIDVAVIPSTFRETYCMALSEAWMGGLAVAVSDLGALEERVIDGVNGRKFPPDDPAALAQILEWFVHERACWQAWRPPKSRTTPQMADDYRSLYHELLS